jgi:hypothetical protein
MTHDPATNGQWRVLIHDSTDPADPKWILAVVASPRDVRPAQPGAQVDDVTAVWVASSSSLRNPVLTALPGARCWRVDEPR